MRKYLTIIISAIFIISMSIQATAGTWKQDAIGYWYVNDDGSYPVNTWMSIDGKEYYFGADGYLLVNTVTPDGFTVDANGAKITATQNASANSANSVSSVQNTSGSAGGVYITETGKKYHRKPDCGQSNENKSSLVTLEKAKSLGLEACKKCF